jgi:hypothetical protein
MDKWTMQTLSFFGLTVVIPTENATLVENATLLVWLLCSEKPGLVALLHLLYAESNV